MTRHYIIIHPMCVTAFLLLSLACQYLIRIFLRTYVRDIILHHYNNNNNIVRAVRKTERGRHCICKI